MHRMHCPSILDCPWTCCTPILFLAFPFLLQVSLLRVFHQLLANASFRRQPGSSEILRFAVRVVRHIFERLVPDTADETDGKLLGGEYEDGL